MNSKKSKKKKSSELVRLLCWSCGKRVKVSIKFAGKMGSCPKCKVKIQIPTLKTIKSTIKELESQQKKVNDIDFPSLPSLKTIVLENTDPQSPPAEHDKMAFHVNPPISGPEGTAEVLMNSGSTEMNDSGLDLSDDFSNDASFEEAIEAPSIEDLGKIAAPQSRSVRPDDQFITSADEEFYNELANNGGSLEKTETWGESGDYKAVDTNSEIFHTPTSYNDSAPIDANLDPLDEIDANLDNFNISSFEAEPLNDNDDIFGNDDFAVEEPLSPMESAMNVAALTDDNPPLEQPEKFILNNDDPLAQVVEDDDAPLAEPIEIEGSDVDLDSIDVAIDGEDANFVASPDDFFPAEPINIENPEDAEIVESIGEMESQEEVEEIEEISSFEDDISSVEDVYEEEIDNGIEIEGSEILPAGTIHEGAQALIVDGEKSEIEVTDENLEIHFTKIIEEENFTDNADIMVGWQNFQNKQWEKAQYFFSKSIIENQNIATAYYARSLVSVFGNNWHKAIEDINFAKKLGYHKLDVEKRFAQITFHAAKEYWESGAFGKALQILTQIETKNSQALRAKIHWKRAEFLIKHGANKKALPDLDEAIFNDQKKSEIFMLRGKIYFQQEDYEAAAYDFSAAIKRSEQNALALRARSEAYYYLKKYDESLQDIEQAIALDSECGAHYTLKGLLLTQKEQFQEANVAFEKAIELDPNNSNCYFNRGLANIKQNRYDKAIDDFTKASQLSPDKVALFKRAICYQEKPNPNLIQAQKDFKAAENLEADSIYRTDLFKTVQNSSKLKI